MKKIVSIIFLTLVFVFVYLPIVILAVYSFTDSAAIGTIHAFSTHNYRYLFTSEDLLHMIGGTVLLAVGSSFVATLLGTMGAIGTFYSGNRVKTMMQTANQIPVVNADVVTGFSACILLIVVLGVGKETYIPLVIGHVTLLTPFVYLSVMPRLKQMDNSIYEAALDLGATQGQAMRKVLIPQLLPGILSGFVLAVTLSLDDYFITTYTKPATFDTISTYVVNATKGAQTDVKTALWALSTVIFVLVVLFVVMMNISPKRAAKREEI